MKKKRKTSVVDLTDDTTTGPQSVNAFSAMMAFAKKSPSAPAFNGKSYVLLLKMKLDDRAKKVVQLCQDAVPEAFWQNNE